MKSYETEPSTREEMATALEMLKQMAAIDEQTRDDYRKYRETSEKLVAELGDNARRDWAYTKEILNQRDRAEGQLERLREKVQALLDSEKHWPSDCDVVWADVAREMERDDA